MKSAAAESAAVSESSDIYSMACPSRRALELAFAVQLVEQ